MSHKIKDGIVVDSTVYLIDEKNNGFPISMRLLQLLAVMVGSYSVISIFIDCFTLPVSNLLFGMAVMITGTVVFLLILYPSYDMIKLLSVGIIYLILIRYWFKQLQNAFYILENAIIDRAGSYYGFTTFRFKAQYFTATEDTTLLIIMILIPVVALLSIAIIRNRLVSLCYILLILPIAASFALGIIPKEGFLISFILTMLFLSKSNVSGHKAAYKDQKFMINRVNSRAAFILSIMTLALFFIVKLLVSVDKYEEADEIKVAKTNLQDFLFEFSLEDISDKFSDIKWNPVSNNNVATGGLNAGELGRVDQVKYNESEQLRITAPLQSVSEGMYLKGYVGSVYTGDSWNGHTKAMKDRYLKLAKEIPVKDYQPVNGSTLFLKNIASLKNTGVEAFQQSNDILSKYEINKGIIKVDYVDANRDYIYAPYLTDFEETETDRYQWDLYAAPLKKRDSYVLDYYYNLSMEKDLPFYLDVKNSGLEEYLDREKRYREYVYETYTQMPEKGLERLKQDFAKENLDGQADGVWEAVSYVKNYLQTNTQYTLSPGKLPKNKDFVEYFLYENKVGYCSHYASAGVLMLRAMGIPARYAEGYAIGSADVLLEATAGEQIITIYTDQAEIRKPIPQVEVSVKDYNAHAWAEVYIDGSGWYPVEFTPGAGIDNTSDIVENLEMIGEDFTQDSTPTVTPTDTPANPTEVPEEKEEIDTPVIQPEDKDSSGSGQTKALTAQSKLNQSIRKIMIFLGVAVPLSLILAYILYVRKKRREHITDNNNKRALLIYKELEKLLVSSNALPKRGRVLEDYEEYVKEHSPFMKEEEFTTSMEIIRKARFGRGSISENELKTVEYFYQNLTANIFNEISPLKKAYLKVILAF